MNSNELARKVRVALGMEAGRNAGEVGMALAFLVLVGILSWAVFGFATSMVRAGILSLLIS